MKPFDLVIRGGTIVDGSGGSPFEGDVAVKSGRIVAVGKVTGAGEEEIDAKGKLVTPGFIDLHTHYDAQATWSQHLSPSTNHGCTTVLMGNCGVGFAPCRPDQHDLLIRVMEGVEDIPGIVLREGVPWTWETFPEYLDALAARRFDADVGTQIPHSAVRVYVMGQRGADHEPPTDDDLVAMRRIVGEAVTAGAFGFSTSRHPNHRLKDGTPAPSVKADLAEMRALGLGLKDAGKGTMQVAADPDPDTGIPLWRALAEEIRHPMTIGVSQGSHARDVNEWRRMVQFIEQAQRDGLPVGGQATMRPIGVLMSHGGSLHPFIACRSYSDIAHLPLDQRAAALRDPGLRARLIAEEANDPDAWRNARQRDFDSMFALGDPPNYGPTPDASLGAQARRLGVSPRELAYDALLERDGRGIIYYPVSNYRERNLNVVYEMMNHPNFYVGVADGGAHMNYICDSSAPSYMLTHWTRDTRDHPRVPVETAINWLTRKICGFMGLGDRGLVAAGYRADLNVINYDRMRLHPPHIVNDLPAGGPRFVQEADGYVATILKGEITYREGKPTGALPGRLVRGPQPALAT